MKIKFILVICSLSLGLLLGNLLFSDARFRNKQPIHANFCFLATNPDLFGSRRFITYAFISSAQPHGWVLDNPSCPDRILSFTEQLEDRSYREELSQRLRNAPQTSVPVVIEATFHRPSILGRLFTMTKLRLGFSADSGRLVTVKSYKSLGEQRWDPKESRWSPFSP